MLNASDPGRGAFALTATLDMQHHRIALTNPRTALKAAWHVVVHLLVVVIDVTQVLAVARLVAVVLVVHGNAANAAASGKPPLSTR